MSKPVGNSVELTDMADSVAQMLFELRTQLVALSTIQQRLEANVQVALFQCETLSPEKKTELAIANLLGTHLTNTANLIGQLPPSFSTTDFDHESTDS